MAGAYVLDKRTGEYTKVQTYRPDPFTVAVQWKDQGMGRKESWSRWVQLTRLRPDMDAKDWYKIFDSI